MTGKDISYVFYQLLMRISSGSRPRVWGGQ